MRVISIFLIAFLLSSCVVEYKYVSDEGRTLKNRGSEDDDDLRVIKVYRIKYSDLYQSKNAK